MSEWFKEHDWKSCVGLKPTGGSNPLLCAKEKAPIQGCFFDVNKRLRKGDLNAYLSWRIRSFFPELIQFFNYRFKFVYSFACGFIEKIRERIN